MLHWGRYTGRPLRELFVTVNTVSYDEIDFSDLSMVFYGLVLAYVVACSVFVLENAVVYIVFVRSYRHSHVHL